MLRTLGKSGLLFAFVLASGFAAHATSTATITVGGAENAGDASIITVTFNGFVETASYGQFSTPASIASAFGAMFSRDYLQNGLSAQVVCGTNSSMITFTLQGTTTFGALTTTGSTNSFQLTSSGFASDSAQYAATGTVTLKVNGSAVATANYGPESTSTTVAQDLANSASSSLVSVTAFDNSLHLDDVSPGTAGNNISYSVTSTSTNPALPSPSFSGSPSSGDLGGGTGSGTDTAVTVYSFTGTYDPVSNLAGYADSVMGTWTFTPDTLNRLLTAHNTATTSTSTQFASDWGCWVYDAFGNRLSQSMSPTTCSSGPPFTSWAQYNGTVNGTNNNQMSQTNQNALQTGGYDAAGDITVDGVNQYLYDAEGRICAVASTPVPGNTTMTGYLYDADGIRIAKGAIRAFSCNLTDNGFTTTTDYILGPSGEQVSEMAVSGNTITWSHTNVLAAGKLLATYDNTGKGLHFYLDDPLGTRRVQSDYLGVLEQTCSSLPFGDDLTCSGSATTPTEHHFTGKERDTESGNDYFGVRYYASSMGRFMSPDPKIGSAHATSPQSWNRYGYALGNPLKFTDPDGEEAIIFYRPPDSNQSSAKDFGHVFLFVRNDKTGRAGFFDYYPDPGKSAVHRSVSGSRISDHAAFVIESTPDAEDRMLDKMDELTKKNPPFNAGSGGFFSGVWNALTGNVNSCVTMSEQILGAGGISDSASSPTGLWDDLYTGFSNDPDLQTDLGAEGQESPRTGSKYGSNLGHRSALDVMSDASDEAKRQAEQKKKDQAQ